MIFVHLEAIAGDQDTGKDGKNLRDSFTEFVKNYKCNYKQTRNQRDKLKKFYIFILFNYKY